MKIKNILKALSIAFIMLITSDLMFKYIFNSKIDAFIIGWLFIVYIGLMLLLGKFFFNILLTIKNKKP